jgi:HEXXH motif-containing protein
VIRLGNAANAVLTDYEWMSYWIPPEDRYEAPEAITEVSSERLAAKQRLESAFIFLQKSLPLYFLWVSALLRQVAPLRAQVAGTKSHSCDLWPGHIHVSQAPTLSTIIVLLHECSHQYFNMALWCGRVAKPDAPEGYSALKKVNRPLDRILLGFHAFGIVLLALPAVKDALDGADRNEHAAQTEHTMRLVSGLDQTLQEHWESYLEESGKAFYLPLRERLIAGGLLRRRSAAIA